MSEELNQVLQNAQQMLIFGTFEALIYATAMFVQTTIWRTRKTVSFSFGCDKK
jgi:hypothetical protein